MLISLPKPFREFGRASSATSPGPPHPATSPPRWRASSRSDQTAVGLNNHGRSAQTVRGRLREARLHARRPCQGLGVTDASGQMLTFNGVWHSRTLHR